VPAVAPSRAMCRPQEATAPTTTCAGCRGAGHGGSRHPPITCAGQGAQRLASGSVGPRRPSHDKHRSWEGAPTTRDGEVASHGREGTGH
jgi:hypothetical protein